MYAQSGADQFDFSVFVQKKPASPTPTPRPPSRTVASAYPNAKVQSRAEYIDSQAAQIDTFVNLVYGLLASCR